jgi:diguanylate cyclase (GGDEF)-like protein
MSQHSTAQKVLVIDDSTTIQFLVRSFLKDEGVEIMCASTGEEGLRLATSRSPDIILLDVEMPTPDGFEVCRRLKADPATARIPIIFLTSASSTEQKVRGLDLGAVDYVTKPFESAELSARVRASLRNKYMLDLLAHKAMIDGLTGLWNRAYLDQRLVSEISLARRHHHPFSLIMLDVDRFKSINDQHGHPFGDQVLRQVSRLVISGGRSEDIACRYGGEEFAILAPMSAMEGAQTLAEHLRVAIQSEVLQHRGNAVRISCSFGIAELDLDGDDSLLEAADAALYRAKQSGRNCVICADRTCVDAPRIESSHFASPVRQVPSEKT